MLFDATASAVSRQMNRQKFPSPLYAYVLALSAIACGSDAAPRKDPEVGALNANPSGKGGSGASPDSIPAEGGAHRHVEPSCGTEAHFDTTRFGENVEYLRL